MSLLWVKENFRNCCLFPSVEEPFETFWFRKKYFIAHNKGIVIFVLWIYFDLVLDFLFLVSVCCNGLVQITFLIFTQHLSLVSLYRLSSSKFPVGKNSVLVCSVSVTKYWVDYKEIYLAHKKLKVQDRVIRSVRPLKWALWWIVSSWW